MQWIQDHDIVNAPINDWFYKIFIVLSKETASEIDKKIANLSKKDTIGYIQEEFAKSWKRFIEKLAMKKDIDPNKVKRQK